jgi:hypothetical protein
MCGRAHRSAAHDFPVPSPPPRLVVGSWPRVLILPGGPAGPAPPPLQEARGGRGSRSSQQDTGYAAAKIQNGAVCCGTRPWLTHSERSITLTEYYALSYTDGVRAFDLVPRRPVSSGERKALGYR